MMIALSGCAAAEHGELGAVLSPLCVFNCFNSVTYAPGVRDLQTNHVDKRSDLLR